MMNRKRHIKGTVLAVVLCLAAAGSFTFAGDDFLTGKVIHLESKELSLEKRLSTGFQTFKKERKGSQYFTVYMFRCCHQVTIHGCSETSQPYQVGVKFDEINVRKKSTKNKSRIATVNNGGELVGLLFLHKVSRRNSEIMDMQLLDRDNIYDFQDVPVFWMGEVDTDESIRFLEALFEESREGLKNTALFTITMHDSPLSSAFLKKAATGPHSIEIRKNAVFWIGNNKDAESMMILKQIYEIEKSAELREHIVFALHLMETTEAVKQIVRIAKEDASKNVRKQAVFWLGQMATKECTQALKDFVEEGEDTEIKIHAVFAISQLPGEQSVPMLVDIARNNTNPKVKKQAIFWLGQTDSDEALKLFEEILLKDKIL